MPRASYDAAPYRPDHHEAAAHYDAPAEQDYRPQAAARDVAHESQYAAHEPHAGRDFAAHDQHAEPYQPDDRYRVALPSGDYEGDGYYADDGHMPPQGEEGPIANKRRGGIVTIAAVLGLAVIGTAGAFGYRAFTSARLSSSPPVIKADPAPAKTVPAAPAAATADAQSKPFQDRIGGADTATRTAAARGTAGRIADAVRAAHGRGVATRDRTAAVRSSDVPAGASDAPRVIGE